jgi:predicted glycosyltransferase
MYLFFIRHFNDIDHIAPVVWKMHSENLPVAVYCMNLRYDISSDYRLVFLRDLGVRVTYLYDNQKNDSGFLHSKLLSAIIFFYSCKTFDHPGGKITSRLLGALSSLPAKFGGLLFRLFRRLYYDSEWAVTFLVNARAKALCFDHVMPSLYVVNPLLEAAKRLSIPSIALPHGVYLYTNEDTKPKSTESRKVSKFNQYDYIVVPNQLRKSVLENAGVEGKKIFVLGSARYCREWMEVNKRILRKKMSPVGGDGFKIVFMPSKPQCKVDMQRLNKTLEILKRTKDAQILVKPHTRAAFDQRRFSGTGIVDASRILSAELCEWSDAVLVIGSSIITEALVIGKPALYLKYLHANTTFFEETGACWVINNEAELEYALSSLKKDRRALPYRNENVVQYISEVVHGRGNDENVLGRYVSFIETCSAAGLPHPTPA